MLPGFTSVAFIAEMLAADSRATVLCSSSPLLARTIFKAASYPSVTAAPPPLLVRELSTVGGLPVQVFFSFRSAAVGCGDWSSLSVCYSGSPPLDSNSCSGSDSSPTPSSSGPSAGSTVRSGCYVFDDIAIVTSMLISGLSCGICLPLILLPPPLQMPRLGHRLPGPRASWGATTHFDGWRFRRC